MGFRFLGQPFPDGEQIGRLVSAALLDPQNDHAWFATAWAKQSGLGRLAGDIDAFKSRGGRVEAIVGVDEGGATVEGLHAALDLFDQAYVFHDPGGRTFHPKIYVIQGASHATAIVGSGNLTRGGLFTNYEGAVVAGLGLTDASEAEYLKTVRAYYDRILAERQACKALTNELIEELMADPSMVVTSEKGTNRESRGRSGLAGSKIFGGSAVEGLLGAPSQSLKGASDDEGMGDSVLPVLYTENGANEGVETQVQSSPELKWWKKLTLSDAHRKPKSSHQRNYVALSRASFDIDWTTWFRHDLFGDLDWSQTPMRSGTTKEVTVVPAEVYVENRLVGRRNLVVDHAAHRVAKQKNAPTYLNWSSILPLIESQDFTGWWIELSRPRMDRTVCGSFGMSRPSRSTQL